MKVQSSAGGYVAEHITVVETIGHGWQCTCTYCEYGLSTGPRQLCTCQKCGYQWEAQPVQVLHLPWPEYSWEFHEPQSCPSCEGPEDTV